MHWDEIAIFIVVGGFVTLIGVAVNVHIKTGGNQSRGAFDEARSLSDKLLVLTEHRDDEGLRLQAHHAAWTTCMFRGEPAPRKGRCRRRTRTRFGGRVARSSYNL